MRFDSFHPTTLIGVLAVAFMSSLAAPAGAAENAGKSIALNSAKGNCLACHAMPGIAENVLPGNVGMPLVHVKALVKSKRDLREHIWDETRFNKNTVMPPFGKHKILTEEEINKLTDFIYGL